MADEEAVVENTPTSGGSGSEPIDLDEGIVVPPEPTEAPPESQSATIPATTEEVQEKSAPIVSSTKKKRPAYKYDPNKITLRFLFANRDGLAVTIACDPTDTVGEVKGALVSVWPEDLPDCESGDRVRLVCMGKGFLTPDSRTLSDCEVPVFATHATPINVSVRPQLHGGGHGSSSHPSKRSSSDPNAPTAVAQGCGCSIQ